MAETFAQRLAVAIGKPAATLFRRAGHGPPLYRGGGTHRRRRISRWQVPGCFVDGLGISDLGKNLGETIKTAVQELFGIASGKAEVKDPAAAMDRQIAVLQRVADQLGPMPATLRRGVKPRRRSSRCCAPKASRSARRVALPPRWASRCWRPPPMDEAESAPLHRFLSFCRLLMLSHPRVGAQRATQCTYLAMSNCGPAERRAQRSRRGCADPLHPHRPEGGSRSTDRSPTCRMPRSITSGKATFRSSRAPLPSAPCAGGNPARRRGIAATARLNSGSAWRRSRRRRFSRCAARRPRSIAGLRTTSRA